MSASPTPRSPTPARDTLNVKLSLDGGSFQLDHRQLPSEQELAKSRIQQIREQIAAWWSRPGLRRLLILLAVSVLLVLIFLVVYSRELSPRALAQAEAAGYRYTLTGPVRIIPSESSVFQLTLTNSAPLTATQPLSDVMVLVAKKEGALPLVPDRTGWLIEFGDLPPGASATREITVTLNDGSFFSIAYAVLEFQVKNETAPWRPLTVVNLGAYPIPGATRLQNTWAGLLVILTAILGLIEAAARALGFRK